MIQFEKPNYKITDYVENDFYGRFELDPLERGFGLTIGNVLRRVMLSSLPGSAISSVKIEGVLHEFQTIPGVVEDVTTIILNLKSIVIKNHSKDLKVITLKSDKKGPVKASDIVTDSDIEIINKDLIICNLEEGGKIDMKMTVTNGRGYLRNEENKQLLDIKEVGVIATDSNFTPIERVSYEVEKTRVGRDESYDKLILNVWTNGSMKPEEAVALASQIVIEHFQILTNLSNISNVTGMMKEKEVDPKKTTLATAIEDLDLSVRSYNCLKKEGILSVEELTGKTELEIQRIKNLGKKSYKEIIQKIKDLGLEFKEED
ncbi:MAG: DNA-directed RNA polymerase subunit alpha [Clostridiales bacterium]|nr:DNA-directed RNA polymerase subunit alpha [Clostridiales bacterium]